MKVFVAGASGAIGKQLVPMLVAHGHEVTGTSSNAAFGAAIFVAASISNSPSTCWAAPSSTGS
jgi:uncharacterized protein YbjT (DUF2867 family)